MRSWKGTKASLNEVFSGASVNSRKRVMASSCGWLGFSQLVNSFASRIAFSM